MVKPLPVRSVLDATRFTSTTPYVTSAAAAASVRRAPSQAAFASSSSSSSSNTKSSNASRFQSPASSASQKSSPARRAAAPGVSGNAAASAAAATSAPLGGETPAQKVARLRAAHQAAKNAQVSQLDKVIGGTRRAFDSAHRFTIIGLIGFTTIAALLTAYTTVDMLQYNSRRKKEFLAVQAQMEADSLAAARLAFMRGDATPEQAAMVEAAQQKEAVAAEGGKGGEGETIFKVPSLLGAPAPVAPAKEAEKAEDNAEMSAPSGVRSWFSSKISREEEGEAAGSSQRRLGYESLCEEDDAVGLRESDVVRALEQKQKAAAAAYQAVTERAQQALEREKANQREGGPLDRIGLEGEQGKAPSADAAAAAAPTPKKSWW
ncbi:hypothetical protein SBRCBS47491_005652 [Sporothrix bragantina]|uniref:Cytochrome oxidase c assembly-domain-containing protein n=1 Tax=Sporothrix bragantina TaxID=671064 RepID=A0ABP0C0E2_9PEZI